MLIFGFGQVVERIDLGPTGCHAWRQADGAAFARQYSQGSNNLFEPQVYNLAGKEGKMATELPITYWIAGQLGRGFGFSPAWLRGLHLLIFTIGAYFFYLFCRRQIGDDYLALLPPLMVLASPLLLYYGNNTLPNVPAMSMVFIAYWALWRYFQDEGRLRWLFMSAVALSMALLLKASEGIHFVAMVATIALAHLFFKRELHENLRPFNLRRLGSYGLWAAIVLLPFLAWYFYAQSYNETYGNKANLSGFLPIWEADDTERAAAWRGLTVRFFKRMAHRPLWWIMCAMLITYLFNPRTYRSLFNWLVILLSLGAWAYILLFYEVFNSHDYYLVTGLPALIFFTVGWLRLYKDWLTKAKIKWVTLGLSLGLFAYTLVYLDEEMTEYYSYPDVNPTWMDFEPALRAMGVSQDAVVVVMPDYSPNISLFYCNNLGYSDYFHVWRTAKDLNYLYGQGVRYLIAAGEDHLNEDMHSRLGDLVGRHRDIVVYPILPEAKAANPED